MERAPLEAQARAEAALQQQDDKPLMSSAPEPSTSQGTIPVSLEPEDELTDGSNDDQWEDIAVDKKE